MTIEFQTIFELGKMIASPLTGHIDDVIVVNSNGDKIRIYVRHGAHLSAFNVSHRNETTWKRITSRKMFNEGQRASYPLRTYPWFVTDTMLDDGGDVIIMRNEAGLVFYGFDPRKSNESLQELSRDTSFGDLYNWNEANLSVVLIGRFYPDNQLIGVMSRKKTRNDFVVEFYSVDKDRLMSPHPLFPFQESHYVDKEMVRRISEAMDLYLADIQHSGQDNIILRTKNHQLEMYKFNDNYHLQQVAKLSLVDGSQTERFFFVNLTGKSYRDVVHFNQHGLYVYQINNNTDYTLVHYHSGFSETNGWIPEYGESIRLVDTNGDGRDDLIFTGPKGLTVLKFDPATLGWETLLDQSTQLAVSKRFATVVAVVTSGTQSILVTIDKERQLFMDQLLTKKNPQKAFRQSVPSAVELITENRKLCRHAKIPTQVKRNVPEDHILRWTERWTQSLSIPNIIDPVSGSLHFSLPIFQPENFSDPVPYRLSLSYQSQLASLSNIVGWGWSISLPDSCILVDYQGSIFGEDAKFYLAMGGGVLQLKSLKVLEEDGVRLFREPLQPEWTVEYHEKEKRWIIATEMDTYIFGTKDKMEAVRWNLNYRRWRGPGNDAKSLQPIPVAWYLIERQIKGTGHSIIYEYEIDSVNYKNPSTKWTAAVRLKQISVKSFTTLKFDYAPKEKEEYQLFEHPFDSRNYSVFPVPLRQSHYLRGCNIVTQHYRQRLEFKYETDKGKRFLTAIEQPITEDVRESIFNFSYYNDKVNEIRSPMGLKINFRYDSIPNIDLPDPYSIVEHLVEEKPSIDYSHDYATLVFRQRQVPDLIQVKILGVDSHETLAELSPLAATTKLEFFSYNVRSHADFLIVLLETNKEQKICLFHRNMQKRKMKWNRDPSCHRFNHEAIIRSSEAGVAVANSSKPGAIEIFELSGDQSKWIHHRLTSGRSAAIRFEMLGHLIVGYDDHQLFICNPDGTNKVNWKIRIVERLVGLFSDGSAIVKKFQFSTETEKIFLDILKQNLVQLSANSIAVSSLHLNDDHQLLLRIRLFLLNSNYSRSRRREFTVQAENVLELRSEFQNLDSRYQFGYRVTDDGFYRVKLLNLAGNEVDTILTIIKEKRVKEFEKLESEWKKNVTIRRDQDFKSFDSQMQMKLENFKHLVRSGAAGNETEETQNENKSCDDVIFAPCNRQCYEMEEYSKGDDVENKVIEARQNLDECYADDWKNKWENNVKMEGEKLQQLNEKGEKEISELEADWAQRGMDMSSEFNVTREFLRDRENAFAGSFLLNRSAYQTRMIAEGLLVSNDTFIRMRGDDWEKETVNNKPSINEMSIPLGESFVLMDESYENEFQSRNMTLYAQEQNRSIGSPLHRLLDIQRIVNRYPVYLAYGNGYCTKVILFNNDGKTLDTVLTLSNEQLVSEMSSYQHLTTLAITSQAAEKMKLVTRSLRSMNPLTDAKQIVVRQVTTSNSDASLTRSIGYQWDIDANGNVMVTTIPGNDRKLAGWLKESWTRAQGGWVRKAFQMFDAHGQSVEGLAQSIDKSDDPSDSSILWDSSKQRIVSDFSPYRISDQMVSYCGFESYEVNISPWRFVQSNVMESGFALTGSNLLRLENSVLQGTFTPVDQQTIYVASSWIRPSDGSLESSAEQDLEITAHLKAIVKVKETGEEIVGLWGRTMRKFANWFYLEVLIDFDIVKRLFNSGGVDRQIPQFTITIQIKANHKPIDVDHVRFSPMAHDFKATVYRHQRPVSVIGSSGSISQTVYYRGREMAVATDGQLEQVTSSSYTGRLVPAPKGSSLTAAPPSRIVFYPENGGLLENFDSYSFRNRWKDCSTDLTSTWTIAPGRLWHNHQQFHLIVSVDPSVLFGNGSSATVRSYYSLVSSTSSMTWKWNNGQVQLARNSTDLLSTLNVTFENESLDPVTHLPNYGELIFMAEGRRFFVWIDSVLLLDVVVASVANWTSFAFEAQGNSFVEDCVFMANPRTEIEYMDDWGDKMQTIQLESESSVLVSQILYDSLGRPAIKTKLTRVTVVDGRKPLLNYHSNFISGPIDPVDSLSVWQSHRLRGEVDRLNPLDGGVAYFRINYETNPLNEKQVSGQPGLDFAVNGPYATKFWSSINKENINVALNHFPIHRGFRHRMEELPNGTKKVAVLDERGNTVALYVYTPGYDHLLSTYEYDSHNRLVKMLPPLYHERVDTFGKTSFNSETSQEEIRLQETFSTFMSYDRETDRLIRKTAPDTGTVEYYHNRAGQIRLQVHSTSQESEEIDSVVYYEYDRKGVVSRTGFLEQMPMPRQQFEKSLQQGTLSNAKDYQLIDRTEDEERHYDPSLSGGERNATFVVHHDDHIVVEDMRWDSQDRLLEYKRVGCGDWQIRKMFYPKSNRLHSIQYPSGVKLEHRYNKLGQLIALQLDGQSGDLVSFSYDGSGQLGSEYHLAASPYGFNRTFHYNSPGYLERITDPYLTENVSYTTGGYGQSGSGDGIVMQTTFNATWPTDSDWRWFQLSNKSIPASCCLKALERNGFVTKVGRPMKDYYPAAVDEKNQHSMPLVCGGGNGQQISRMLAQKRMPHIYGHRYAYGNHQELVKAKYFSEETEKYAVPFQPDTLADQTALNKQTSREIWKQTEAAGFIMSDQRKADWLTVVANRGIRSLVRKNDLNALLLSANTSKDDVTIYQDRIEMMILNNIGQRRDSIPKLDEFQKIFRQWKGVDGGCADIAQLGRTAEKIHKDLNKVKGNAIWLDPKLVEIFRPYSKHLPDFIRILNQRLAYGLGEHPFDVASYDIDANGNHGKFLVGFNIYKLKYGNIKVNQIQSVKIEILEKLDGDSDKAMDHDSRGNVVKALHKDIERIEYNGASMRTSAIHLTDKRKVRFAYDSQGERILKRVLDKDDQLMNETEYVRDEDGRVLFDRRSTYSSILKNVPLVIVETAYVYGPRGLVGFIHARQIVHTLARKQSRQTAKSSHPVKSISKVTATGLAFDNMWNVMIQSAIHKQSDFKLSQESVALSLLRPDGFGLQYSITKDQRSFSNTKEHFKDGADWLTTIENANNRKRKRQNEIFTDDESLMLGCLPGKRRRKRAESRKRPATCRVSNPDVEMQKKMKEDPISVLNQAAISTKSITDWQDFKRLKIPFFNGGTYPFQLIPGDSGSSYHLKVGASHNDVSTVHGYWMNTNEEIQINPMGETRFIFTGELQGCSIYIKYNYDAVGKNGQHEPTMTVYHHNRQFQDTIYLENGRYVHDDKEIDELKGVKELFDGKRNILKAENGAIVPTDKIYYEKGGKMEMVVKLNDKKMDGIIKKNVELKKREDDLAAKYDQVIRYEDYFALPGNYNEKMAQLGQPLTFVTPVLYRDKDGHWFFSSQKISYTKGLLDKENFQMHSKLGQNFLQNSNKRIKIQDLLFQHQIGPGSANKVNSDLFIKQLGSIPRNSKEAAYLAKRKFPSQKEYKEFMQSFNEARSRKPVPVKRSNVIDVGDLDLESPAKIRRPPRSALHKFDDLLECQFKMISSGASNSGSWIDLLSTGRHIFTSILSLNYIRKFVKMSLLPLLLPDESEDAAGRNVNELIPRLAVNRSDYRDVSIGNCHSTSPDVVVCEGYFGKTTVFTNCKKIDTLKQDTYSRCRPIEWHGEPSVTCRGEQTTFIYTPYNRNSAAANLFNAVDGWLILAKTSPGIYRELVKFASHLKNVWKGSGKKVNVGISDKDKESWKLQLTYLEQLVVKQQQVDWALPLLSELQQQISSLSCKTVTETMDDVRAVKTMAERLSALTEDVEQNQDFYDCQEELTVDEPQFEMTSAETFSTRLHHLTHNSN